MTDQEIKLHEQIAEMQSDIRTTVKTFLGITKSLGINLEDFKGGQADLMSKLPPILGRLMTQLMSGTMDTKALSDITAISPIMEKYKPLVEDIIEPHGK